MFALQFMNFCPLLQAAINKSHENFPLGAKCVGSSLILQKQHRVKILFMDSGQPDGLTALR